MRRGTLRFSAWTLAAIGATFALSACGSADEGNDTNAPVGQEGAGEETTTPPTPEEQVQQILDSRKTDYGEALRTASLKLRDRLPDFAEIQQLVAAGDVAAQKPVYEKLVDAMIASPDFKSTMVKFWKDTFRVAQVGNVAEGEVSKDFAANFAAMITTEDGRSYTELFTATENTCPTFDAETNTFTPGACPAPADQVADAPTVGILTDPGIMSAYFANMGFRRARFVQETFVCSKYPAEYSDKPVPMGNATYTGTFDFKSIMGKEVNPAARIDFHDTQAVICANCHANLNHVTPLFINYAENGGLRATPQVEVPIPQNPKAALSDYLPEGEPLAWRKGVQLTDMRSLGAALAADPDVPACAVNRVWNYAMSRGDIVNDLATIPKNVTATYVEQFKASKMNLKETIRAVFKSEDFTKF